MLSIRLKKQTTTNVADTTFKGLDGTDSQNRGQGYRGNKNNRGKKVPIGLNPPPLHKGWERNLSKIDGNWGGGGRGLKPFARKGGGKAKWGGFVWEIEGCHIILRFSWRPLDAA